MRIFVINVGSATLKFSVLEFPAGTVIAKDQVAIESGRVDEALRRVQASGVLPRIDAIGHRVAHGGETFRETTRVDVSVIEAIEANAPLAPLHNPPAVSGIRMAMAAWPNIPQFAVFDTGFHAQMPPHAAHYAVPEAWRRVGVRRFGFHGTSHKYVMERVGRALHRDPGELRILSCHLGNGASICAIEHGVSVDTSMGMSALEGLVMGSRSGDVDPGMAAHLNRVLGLSAREVEMALYTDSGLTALSGLGHDMRQIEAAASRGDGRCQLALAVFAYRVRKYIGAYAAAMGGVDALAFTGGIGENSAGTRERVCERLSFLGIELDPQANARVDLHGFEAPEIQLEGAPVSILVMQAQEQWMIAQEVYRLLVDERAPQTGRVMKGLEQEISRE